MDIGNKIKQLRFKAGMTQEQLAGELGISAQSVSKWETGVTMPDITLLPILAGELGVSIDELFDLTAEQKLHRIEQRMLAEEELQPDVFREYEDFLKGQLSEAGNGKAINLLAKLYHHRMEADARRVSRYAREAILRSPEEKDCQWLLQMAEGQYAWDWNVSNHARAIDFYKEVIRQDAGTPKTPLPYYYLIDQLIADRRTEEATAWLEKFSRLPAHKPCMVPVYRAHIALAEFEEKRADGIMEEALKEYGDNVAFLFESAQYYARKCQYDKAIGFYEASWAAEEGQKPRFTDALQGIAVIHEIQGEWEKASATYGRIVTALKEEWHLTGDDREVQETEREISRLLQRKQAAK